MSIQRMSCTISAKEKLCSWILDWQQCRDRHLHYSPLHLPLPLPHSNRREYFAASPHFAFSQIEKAQSLQFRAYLFSIGNDELLTPAAERGGVRRFRALEVLMHVIEQTTGQHLGIRERSPFETATRCLS